MMIPQAWEQGWEHGWEHGWEVVAETLRKVGQETPDELKILAKLAHKVCRRAINDMQRKTLPHMTPPNLLAASFLLLFLLGRIFLGINAWCLILYGTLAWVLTTIFSLLLGWSSFIYQKNFSSGNRIPKHQEIPMEGALILLAMLLQGSIFGIGHMYVMSCFSRSGESVQSFLMGQRRSQIQQQEVDRRPDGTREENKG